MAHVPITPTGDPYEFALRSSAAAIQRAITRRRILDTPDHAELLTRTVHMRFLPLNMEQGRLAEICSGCGPYTRVRICGNSHNHAWIYGFVEFVTVEGAQAMIRLSGLELGHNGRNPLRMKCTLAKQPIVDRIFHDADLQRGIPCLFGQGTQERRSLRDAIDSYLQNVQRYCPGNPANPNNPMVASPMSSLIGAGGTEVEEINQIMTKASTLLAQKSLREETIQPLLASIDNLITYLSGSRQSEDNSTPSSDSNSSAGGNIEYLLSALCIAIALCAVCQLKNRVSSFVHHLLDHLPQLPTSNEVDAPRERPDDRPLVSTNDDDDADAVLRDVAKEVFRMQQEAECQKREQRLHRFIVTVLIASALSVECLQTVYARCLFSLAYRRLHDVLGERMAPLEECCRGVKGRDAFQDRWPTSFPQWFFASYRATAGLPPDHVELLV